MQNLILFKSVINSDRDFVYQSHKILKDRVNFIGGEDLSFYEMNTFVMINSS